MRRDGFNGDNDRPPDYAIRIRGRTAHESAIGMRDEVSAPERTYGTPHGTPHDPERTRGMANGLEKMRGTAAVLEKTCGMASDPDRTRTVQLSPAHSC